MIADLHCHSYYSDGMFSPQVLLEKAKAAGVELLALTDHDTIEGVAELQSYAYQYDASITVVPGIEISARWRKYDIHIIGLNINIDNEDLKQLIIEQNNSRIKRSYQIAECISLIGITNVIEKVKLIAGHNRLARPHFAQLLVNEGKVKDLQTAFKRYLTPGKMAYVVTPWVSLVEAIEVIKKAQGDAILAHPLKYKLTKTKLNQLIAHFKEADGDGLEVISGESKAVEIKEMANICEHYQLLSSTGSDYHSELSRISLGKQQQLPLNCKPIWHHWTD